MDKTKYIPGIVDPQVRDSLKDVADDVIKFCKDSIKKKFARADYKELLQLTLIFLGSDGEIDDTNESGESDEHDALLKLSLFVSLVSQVKPDG